MPTRTVTSSMYPRHSVPRLLEALADSPVVLIHGPRQCGKTTLARTVGERLGYAYASFDDSVVREAAGADPEGFVADLPERVVLDEVQRVPALFSALKRTVDEHRTRGRFLLTGSSHVLTVPKLADSLAGRMEVVRLHPLSQAELQREPPRFLDALFAGRFPTRSSTRLGVALAERIVAGGYPPALARQPGRRRANWHRDYIDALVQRDVQELARIRFLEVLPRLLTVAAAQTARLFNLAELGSPFGLSRPTIRDYVVLLERVFLIERLQPWHSNRMSRLVKTHKLHFVDTGLACAQLNLGAEDLHGNRMLLGLLMETFVFQELRRQAACHEQRHTFYHYRDKDGVEVDAVIERGPQAVAGVEVKAGATVRESDFCGLRKLQRTVGECFAGGAVLYDGEVCVRFGDGLYAVPVRQLWEGSATSEHGA